MRLSVALLTCHPRVFRHMTGLTPAEFEDLVRDVLPRFHAHEQQRLSRPDRQRAIGGGKPFTLAPREQFLLTVIWLRLYPMQEVLGFLFGVTYCTVGRVIHRVLPLLEAAGRDTMRMPDPGKQRRRTLDALLADTPDLAVVIDTFEQAVQHIAHEVLELGGGEAGHVAKDARMAGEERNRQTHTRPRSGKWTQWDSQHGGILTQLPLIMLTRDPAVERMLALLDTWEQHGDGRCVFLRCYSMMTGNMLQALEDHRFYNQAWVYTLLQRFADYYFDALDAYEQGSEAVPPVWKQTHELASAGTTTAIENLLLGINAHINYDLALAMADVPGPEWGALSPSERRLRYQDHCEINHVIAATIDAVQAELAARYAYLLHVLDHASGRVDEWKTARYITAWRDDVWRNAVRLLEAPDPAARAAVRQEIEAIALKRAALIFFGDERRSRLFGYKTRWLRRLGLF